MMEPGNIDDRIHIAIKSFKRAGRVKTLKSFPSAAVWVPESMVEEYEAAYPGRVIAIPDTDDGNLGRKQNAILNRTPRLWTLILDDDIVGINRFEGGNQKQRLTPDECLAMVRHFFLLASEMGVSLWGINVNSDEAGYRAFCPFSLLAPILGPFHGHLSPKVRYDERMGGRDDVDFWLQTIRSERYTLRVNKYHYIHDHVTMPGGWVSQRTMEREMEDGQRLQRKWGSRIVSIGGQKGKRCSSGENLLNTLVRVPIEGC